MFEWNAKYMTGIGSIDAQHQTLFQIGAKLQEAMGAGQGKTVVISILERLVKYTESHFAHEERLMRANGYPDLEAHKAQHDDLTRQVREFQERVAAGQATITVQLLTFIRGWLGNHIEGSDLKYAPYLIKRAVE